MNFNSIRLWRLNLFLIWPVSEGKKWKEFRVVNAFLCFTPANPVILVQLNWVTAAYPLGLSLIDWFTGFCWVVPAWPHLMIMLLPFPSSLLILSTLQPTSLLYFATSAQVFSQQWNVITKAAERWRSKIWKTASEREGDFQNLIFDFVPNSFAHLNYISFIWVRWCGWVPRNLRISTEKKCVIFGGVIFM